MMKVLPETCTCDNYEQNEQYQNAYYIVVAVMAAAFVESGVYASHLWSPLSLFA
jgi:hypothetical protein